MATVVNATAASVAAPATSVAAGSVITLPELVITEGVVGALAAANVVGIALPSGYTIQKSTGDANDGDTLTNGTDVTVKVVNAAGTDVTSSALGTTPTISVQNGNAAATANQVMVTMSAASSSTSGVYKITINGLKVKSSTSASTGDVNAVIAGADAAGLSTVAALGAVDASTWTSKAGATKQTVKVGGIASATLPTTTATPSGTISSQQVTASFLPATNDLGKQGSVFVAVALPSSLGGGVFFMNGSQAWTQYTSCATAPNYTTGTLGAISSFNLLAAPSDLSGLKGSTVYVGYGVGGVLSPAGTACTNMLNNGTYNLVYTIN
jgi:hypothetical protein